MTAPVDTWGSLHAGDIVLGADGQQWGVERLLRPTPGVVTVTAIRHGDHATASMHDDLPVTVVRRADTSEEYRAAAVLLAAGLTPEVVSERWES
jgi:hypothetical protein